MNRLLLVISTILILLYSFNIASAFLPAIVPQAGHTASYSANDNSVALPDPRFTDNGNGTATDNLSGLTWLKNAGCASAGYWGNAMSWSNNLASGNCSLSDGSLAGDWRLPTISELVGLTDLSRRNPALPAGHPFEFVRPGGYWTSTRADSYGNIKIVFMGTGNVSSAYYNSYGTDVGFAWPCVWDRFGTWLR